jgi:uncharacterized protein YjbI with pentapeptide repeats
MATKKQLVNRWLVEPGLSMAARIGQFLLRHADVMGRLEREAFAETGLYLIPSHRRPVFDTKQIFDMIEGLPFRDEIPNGRDLRGIPSIGGREGGDFQRTDFSHLPGTAGYGFIECNLDGAVFDDSKGEFDFRNCSLCGTQFRKVHFVHRVWFYGSRIQCDFTGAKLKQASFSGPTNGSLNPRDRKGIDLRASSFTGAGLKNADLVRCDLRHCRFRDADLTGASIQEAIIDNTTDFRGANLSKLWWQERRDNYGKLFLQASDWRQGIYDSTTIHD